MISPLHKALVQIFAVVTMCQTLGFNAYKFKVMHDCYVNHTVYKFPVWSPNAQPAKSSPEWLMGHLGLSMLNVFLVGMLIMLWDDRPHKLYDVLDLLQRVVHILFCVIILPSVTHLGAAPMTTALLINGGFLIGAVFSWASIKVTNFNRLPVYLLIISFPVYLEIGLWLMHHYK